MNLVANQMANLRVTNQMGKILGVRVLVESLVADVVIFFEFFFLFRSARAALLLAGRWEGEFLIRICCSSLERELDNEVEGEYRF